MKTGKVIIGAGIGVLVTLVAAIPAVMSAGGGHGHYEFARVLFPFAMLLTRLTGDSITLPLILLGLLQFPLYGVVIGLASTRTVGAVIVAMLIFAHAVAAVICFSGAIPNFS